MRLLQIGAGYPPFVGGAEIYAQAIAERFVAQGHQVNVVCSNAGHIEYYWNAKKLRILDSREIINGVDIIRCPVWHLPFSPLTFYLLRRFAMGISEAPKFSAPILRLLAPLMPQVHGIPAELEKLGANFDVIHGINIALEWPLIAGWRFARKHGIPFIATPLMHTGDLNDRAVVRGFVMPHQLEVLQDADAVIAQTQIEKSALVEYGVPAEHIAVVGQGVELDKLQGGDAQRFREKHNLRAPVVTFLGVATQDKGTFHLVNAVIRLWQQGVDCELVIAGSTVDAFDKFYAELPTDIRGRIKVLGRIPDEEKQDLLATTDMLVLPSRIDSFGIVLIEAWSYGKPVIGGNAGGIPDVIDNGIDGLLVDFGDEQGLLHAIKCLLGDPELRQSMGQAGYNKVAHKYTWTHIYDQVERICMSVRT